MKKLDDYFVPLIEKQAEELHLYADVPPTYLLNQQPIRELDQTFSNDEIIQLIEEVIGQELMKELEENKRLNYKYFSSIGSFRFQIRWNDGDLKIRFTLLKKRPKTNPHLPMPSQGSIEGSSPKPPANSSKMDMAPSVKHAIGKLAIKSIPIKKSTRTPAPKIESSQDRDGPDAKDSSNSGLDRPNESQPLLSLPDLQVSDPQSLEETEGDSLSEIEQKAIFSALSEREYPKEIDRLFRLLMQEKGSDLHLSSKERPIIRVDGQLRKFDHLPLLKAVQIAQLLAPIIPERNRIEFTETWDTDFAYSVKDIGRFRANVFMDRKGIGAVFRLIPSKIINADQLGLPRCITDLCYLSKGLVLVTGPTGSGKSTTLSALVDLINRRRDDHILTIEDPIEFVHPNKRCLVNQREIGVHTRSFQSALRAALREDPDIILVGEMRDLETVAIAIETAETGHLVFGTLHTTSAMSTVDRIIDQFPGDRQEQIRMMLANSLKAVVSQTLLRKKGGGRVAAMEILLVTPGVSNLIREKKLHQIPTIMQTSRKQGMQLLNDVLFDFVSRDIVEIKEAYTKSIDKVQFIEMLKDAGISISAINSSFLHS